MSLRQQAKILGISPAHLSRMVNGVRPWNSELKERYEQLVGNTFGNTLAKTEEKPDNRQADLLWRIRLAA